MATIMQPCLHCDLVVGSRLRSGENARFHHKPQVRTFFRNLFIIIYHSPHCFVKEGWGGGDVSMFLAFAFLPMLCYARRLFSLVLAHIFSFTCTQHMEDVTLADLPLRLRTYRMLRKSRTSSALAHMQDVTVANLLLHLHTCGCYTSRSSLSLADTC